MAKDSTMNMVIRMVEATYHHMPTDEFFDPEFARIVSEMGPEGADVLAAMTALATVAFTCVPDKFREMVFAGPDNEDFNIAMLDE